MPKAEEGQPVPEGGDQAPDLALPKGGDQAPDVALPKGGDQAPDVALPEGGDQAPDLALPKGGDQAPDLALPKGGDQAPDFAVTDGDEDGDDLPPEDGPLAPPVVAVMITRDPGPWFEESLSSLVWQDYPNLVLLVVDAGSEESLAARVASVAPNAFLRRLESDEGYGASANSCMGMVEGASHYLFCHDDAAPDPDAVRIMVEEAYRSNAAIVAPKMVAWDDPRRILSVGMNADKLGALADRAVPGEIDQEQHDAVRDVFVAPGGFMLVRADLFSTLGGFDPAIRIFGEDLDLSWRAQVAGARIVVAPSARVRHIEVTRSGTRWREGVTSHNDVLAMVRRHELRTLLKCYSALSLLRVVPQAVLATLAELLICVATGQFPRARAVAAAWTWNWSHRSDLRHLRRAAQGQRHLPDRDVREYQARGFSRFSSFVRRLTASYTGVHHLTLHGVETSEESDVEHLSFAGRWGLRNATLSTPFWFVLFVALFVGMRHWATAGLPLIGKLAPLGSSVDLVHRYVNGRSPVLTGTYSPAPPAMGILGVAGTLLFGSTAFLQKLLFLGAIPLGALGAYRLAFPFGRRLPRMTAAVGFLVVPLPYDLFSHGDLQALVACAATPWLAARLFAVSGLEPYSSESSRKGYLSLGLMLALVFALVPGELAVLAIVLVGTGLGSATVGGGRGWARMAAFAGAGVAVAGVLLFPWLAAFAGVWHGAQPLVGQGGAPWAAPGISTFVRFDIGFLGGGVGSWALLIAAALPIAAGRGWRFRWAVRMWMVLALSWLIAWSGAHGWLGGTTLDPGIPLVAGQMALGLLVALAACTFAADLHSQRFGWRQAASVASGLGLLVASLPVVASLAGGRFDLPSTGWSDDLGALVALAPTAAGHAGEISGATLWIGNPGALPLASWPLAPGVSFAVSDSTMPSVSSLWAPVAPHRARLLGEDILRAREGLTSRLGHDLGALGVRAVLVPLRLAPSASPALPPAPWLVPTLDSQSDLRSYRVDPTLVAFATSPSPVVLSTQGMAPPVYRYAELALQLVLWLWVLWSVGIGDVAARVSRRRRRADHVVEERVL